MCPVCMPKALTENRKEGRRNKTIILPTKHILISKRLLRCDVYFRMDVTKHYYDRNKNILPLSLQYRVVVVVTARSACVSHSIVGVGRSCC